MFTPCSCSVCELSPSSGECNYYANVSPSFSNEEERIAPSQNADREREHECDPDLDRIPSVAPDEKAIRENIQTLDGGGDRDVVIMGEGREREREIPFKRDHILAMMSFLSTKGVLSPL